MDIGYLGAFIGGFLSFLSPCVLPLVPPYLCFLAGMSFNELIAAGSVVGPAARRIFMSAVAFVLGFTTVFVLLGATATSIAGFVADNMIVLSRIAGGIIILFGLHFMGVLRIGILYRESRFRVVKKPPGMIGAYVVGLAFAFGWTPCVGPVLATVLAVAAARDTVLEGASLLGIYALGIGLPFLAAAIAVRPFLGVMGRLRPHMGKIEFVLGLLLVLSGALIMAGAFYDIGYWLQKAFPNLGRLG